ncbi:MAG: porin family protein [Chlorobiales bacterium]|jgi:hypothetical protein|nr:porin family protein [Chlorobiales bacterium]
MRGKLTLLVVAMTLCFSVSALAAEREKEVEFGISGGILLPGSINIEDFNPADTKISPLFRLIVDTYITEKFMIGGYVNFASISLKSTDSKYSYFTARVPEQTVTMYEFGGALKGRFLLNPKLVFKPGLNLGYRMATGDFFSDNVKGFAVNFSAELQFLGDSFSPYIDGGFLAQPNGGNTDWFVTFPPVLYLTGGISF